MKDGAILLWKAGLARDWFDPFHTIKSYKSCQIKTLSFNTFEIPSIVVNYVPFGCSKDLLYHLALINMNLFELTLA